MFYIKLMHIFEKNIKSLGLELPEVPSPVANYVPFKIVENLIHVSGQAPILDGNIKYVGQIVNAQILKSNRNTLFGKIGDLFSKNAVIPSSESLCSIFSVIIF